MTPHAAVLYKAIACLAVTSGLQCGAVMPHTDVFRTNLTSLTPQEKGLFLAASLATVALLLAIRVASKCGAATTAWVAPSFPIPTPNESRRSLLHAAPTKFPGFAIDRASMRSRAFGGDFFFTSSSQGPERGLCARRGRRCKRQRHSNRHGSFQVGPGDRRLGSET